MAIESVNIPIPSEIVMPFSGYLVSQGKLTFWAVVLAGALGNLMGSLINYYIGYLYGRPAIALISKIFLINDEEIRLAEKIFTKWGVISVFLTRLMPVLRTFISFPAGTFKVNLWEFSLLTFTGSFIWSAFLTYIGVIFGANWETLSPYFRQFEYLIIGFVILLIVWRLRHHFIKSKISSNV